LTDDIPIGILFGLLFILLLFSAFFSGTETALMSVNRYRLRHKARAGNKAAQITEKLLVRPDRLIGLILLGNNAVNLTAAALVTVMALRIGGESAILAGTLILTFLVLIFAEVAPKTIAALHPMQVAMPAAMIYYPLLKVAYPLVWAINLIANGVLRILGVKPDEIASHSLSAEELRTVVAEAGALVPSRHQKMLLSIFDLDGMTVDDVMVSRQDIVGLDLDEAWESNLAVIRDSRYHRLPVYRGDIDNIVGVAQVRMLLSDLGAGILDEQRMLDSTREPYFVPEGTRLNKQLLNFEQQQRRAAFVVDEYGDVQGLITTEDILREIVGEFDRGTSPAEIDITRESDDSFIVDASANIRQLNRLMNWNLPTDGPKTLNGLIVEQLETIPESGTRVTVSGYPIEILDADEHTVNSVRVATPRENIDDDGLSIAKAHLSVR
jgi:Mg2+/Co2+ transporter CorB